MRLANVGGMEIRFHFSILFSLLVTWFIFRPVDVRGAVLALLWLTGFLLCILLHELGHALAAKTVGVEVKSIVVWLLGGWTNLSHRPENPLHNFVISAAGPMVNMLLSFLCVLVYILLYLFAPREADPSVFIWFQTFNELFFSLALLNIILVVFNLLPIYPLDGGNIMHSLLDGLFGRSNADLITMLVSIPVLMGLIGFGIFTRDYLLLASCILIGLAIGTLNRSALTRINLWINYLFKRSGYYYLKGDYERAAQLYTRDIEQEPEQAGHYLARAACLLNMLQKERALADVERALKISPGNVVALQLRGEMYAMDKDYDSALEFYSRAQEVNPNWAVPYFDRASIHLDKKEYESALADLNKATALMHQFPLFYVVRSLAHFRLGDLTAAHRDQDTAVRLSEKDALTVSEVNMMLFEGNLDWAEDYYGRILDSRPRSYYALQGRADAYRVNRDFQRAVMDYTRAIQLNQHEMDLYLGRGKCYLALGEIEQAADDFRHAAITAEKLHLKRQADELLKSTTLALHEEKE
jgi:tetratricopeptide (TPR) repeat protein